MARTVSEVQKPSPHPRQTEQTDETIAGEPAKVASGRGRVITGALAALVVISASATWYLAGRPEPADIRPAVSAQGKYTPGSLPSEPGSAAVRTAVKQVTQVLSYDYRTLKEDLRAATSAMTPEFTRTYRDTFTKVVKPMAAENKAVTRTLVMGAGLVRLADDDTSATCLVFVDQLLVRSTGQPRTKIGRERVIVELRWSNDRWLIDDIKPR